MSFNPYKDLPDHQFWRRAVAGVEPFRFDPVVSTRFSIDKQDRIATAGSCFAQHISNRLSRIGFNYFITESGEGMDEDTKRRLNYGVFSARFGNLYTVRQLLQLFEESMGERSPSQGIWIRDDAKYVDALRPQICPEGEEHPEKVSDNRRAHLQAVRRMFEECNVFVFTLGLTESWRSRIDGTVYPVAPGVSGGSFDPELHEFINFDVVQVMGDLDIFLTRLKGLNSSVRVILTVSPVPLIATYEQRNVLVSTTYSKSVLRVAAEAAHRKFDWVDYFPSYEIITGNFNNGAYFEADYRGINPLGVDHAMRCFLAHYTRGGATQLGPAIAQTTTLAVSDIVCDEEALDQVRV